MNIDSEIVNKINLVLSAPIRYDEDELRLKDIFHRINPQLADILDGIIKALADEQNPDRFHQVAHSIRGITGILVRDVNVKTKYDDGNKDETVFNNLEQSFEAALKVMPTPTSPTDTQDQHTRVRNKFSALLKMLKEGALTVRQCLRRYFGEDKELERLPKPIHEEHLNAIREWDKNNEYFVSLTHYDGKKIDPKEFLQKWIAIKNILIYALSHIYDVAVPLLDEAMSKDFPPDE